MFVVPPAQPPTTSLPRSGSVQVSGKKPGSEIITSPLLSPISSSSMERGAPEYQQSGLPSPYPSTVGDTQSEASSADHATAATAAYGTQQEVRPTTYSATATPTSSDYGAVYPGSARSATFPDTHIRSHYPASNHGSSSGGMAHTPTSPSVPMQDGRNHQSTNQKSDSELPIDPSIAAPSPTTYAHGPAYSPYAPPQDMSHSYTQHTPGSLYQQARPDWGGYQTGGPIPTGHHVFSQTPASAAAQSRPNQVYSFVPIPGAQQHKRPRRRYEEIERMYKCGWNGCEKAYGTLNHLNAHVTMQAHGAKRTPEEFKEIRKEWKARKKEEEAARKAEEERLRAAANAAAQNGGQDQGENAQPPTTYATARPVQLPPIGYQNAQYPAPPSAGIQAPLPADYTSNHVYPSYSPASPYGQPSQGMYSQHNAGQANH